MAMSLPAGVVDFTNRVLKRSGLRLVPAADSGRSAGDKGVAPEPARTQERGTNGRHQAESDLAARVSALERRLDEDTIHNVIRYAMKAHWRTIDLIEQLSGSDKPDTCPLCDYSGDRGDFREALSHCIFHGGRLLRHVCPACDVIFGPQKMLALDDEMLDLDYRNLYRIYSEGDSTASVIRTFYLLEPRKSGTYLDFGCGGEWAGAIERLRQEGWNIFGFEPSASRSSEYVFSNWEEVEARQFDGILSHNVLEHLFDPAGTTRRLGQLLTPDGRIVHTTPCFDYSYDFSHYHVFFFTGRSPEILAERSGMRIEDWVRDGEYIACIMQNVS
ncbi:MAG: class I SAM-dependent methyltransferase [Rhodomicrobiaceae bacterium]